MESSKSDVSDKNDKRKQFQITVLTNKLNQYNTSLKELLDNKEQLCNDISQVDTLKYNYKRHILITEKSKLEVILEGYRKEYTELRTNQAITLNYFKLLPATLASNLAAEQLVFEEECDTIDARIEEAKQLLSTEMQQQELDKLALQDAINDYTNQIAVANDTITQIQVGAHSFRKNTLAQLHSNKQQKKETLLQIDSLQTQSNTFDSHIAQLTTENIKLLELKTAFINSHYNQQDNKNILAELGKYITVNENEMNEISADEHINKLVAKIDAKIQSNTIQIESIKNKASRNNIRNSHLIQNLLASLQPRNREKVISYKDDYKMAKQDKTILEDTLAILQNKFNHWETDVIGTIETRYKDTIEQLQNDRIRAQERLDIMISRFNNSHQLECQQLEASIQSYANKIMDINTKIMEVNQEISKLAKQLDELDITQTKLEKLDARIKDIQTAISKIETDLATLQK